MLLSKGAFERQFFPCVNRYLAEDRWGFQLKGPSNAWRKSLLSSRVNAAYRIYHQASQQPRILLGETQIRREELLVKNFGFLSDSHYEQQGEAEERAVRSAERRLATEIGSTPTQSQPRKTVVRGNGAILASMKWTPFLNDSLIMGGVSNEVPFVLAIPDGNTTWQDIRREFRERRAADPNNPLPADVRQAVEAQEMWLEYFNREPNMLWDGFARVLSRELLGLKLFGYHPIFTEHQLGFRAMGTPPVPRFTDYLNDLRASGYRGGRTRRNTLRQHLSEFLFNDATALQAW